MRETLPHQVLQLEKVRRRVDDFDVLHFHTDQLHFPIVRHLGCAAVTTTHGRLDLPDYQPLFAEFPDMALVSVSDDQRKPLAAARWIATVLHGLPANLYSFSPDGADGYLAFLGRISPEKRPDRAIEIARRAGVQLRIAAKVDRVDQTYFEEVIRPLLRDPRIDYVGEINEGKSRPSSPRQGRCSFRSTGPSLSVWSRSRRWPVEPRSSRGAEAPCPRSSSTA